MKKQSGNRYQITFDEAGMEAFDAFIKARKQAREGVSEPLAELRQRVEALEAGINEALNALSNLTHGGAQYNPDALEAAAVLRETLDK